MWPYLISGLVNFLNNPSFLLLFLIRGIGGTLPRVFWG